MRRTLVSTVRIAGQRLLVVAAAAFVLGSGAIRSQDRGLARSRSGIAALQQSLLDARSDGLVLLVASHPDDRYGLPAVFLRYRLGMRVAVLLATRGGGGQNGLGPETGDALERIRTREAEAGCRQFDAPVYFLNRPDLGFRRSAAETFAEWNREETHRELVRVIRDLRPDAVLSTHHAEENHGHDLALAELLPEAVAAAAAVTFETGQPAHAARCLLLGATSTSPPTLSIRGDEFEPIRGASLRRLAHEILVQYQRSPGWPGSADSVFGTEMVFSAVPLVGHVVPGGWHDLAGSLFAEGCWPGASTERSSLPQRIEGLERLVQAREQLIDCAVEIIRQLGAVECPAASEAALRRQRRVDALHQVVLQAAAVEIEVEPGPNAVAVRGEELVFPVTITAGGPRPIDSVRVMADGGEASFEPAGAEGLGVAAGASLRGVITFRVPLAPTLQGSVGRSAGDRFASPARLHFILGLCGIEAAIPISLPVELRPAVELVVLPRLLMCPSARKQLQFTVEVIRNSALRVEGPLEVHAPAGYQVEGQKQIALDSSRGTSVRLTLGVPEDGKSGVDVVRISLGENLVRLPLHKVDVAFDPSLRIGLVRGRDDALQSVLDVGGFGLQWSELSDSDLAVRNLADFDTIVVDVRALRDRPGARRSFNRLLEFCCLQSRRLVVMYHKDVEFEPAGEVFLAAPLQPFKVGRSRVSRADAPVRVLRPQHCLLNVPNRILPSDWDGWEQERGLYFPNVYSEQYEEIVEMNDPGMPPERSALLYATPGAGEYVYCALALWRQLKKLHPGAVRLVANLLTPRHR